MAVTKAKRENNSGTVRQRKDGRWEGRYQYGKSIVGKPLIKYFYSDTERGVKAEIRKFKQKVPELPKTEPTRVTVDELMRYYLYTIKYGTIKDASFDRLERTNNNHISPAFGEMPLCKLETDDIQKLLNSMATEYSISTMKKVYELLNQFLKFAAQKKYVPEDLMMTVKVPSSRDPAVKPVKIVDIMTDAEIKCLYNLTEADVEPSPKFLNRWKMVQMYIFMLNTGVRCGEALALKFSDINLKDKYVQINKSVSMVYERDPDHPENKNGRRKKIVTTPKTQHSVRVIPLNYSAVNAVENIILYNKKKGVATDTLCTTSNGDPMEETRFQKLLEVILTKHCPEHYMRRGVHSLRHTFASMCIRRDIDIKVVSELLGHSNTAFTYAKYVHVIQQQKAKAVNMIDIYSVL